MQILVFVHNNHNTLKTKIELDEYKHILSEWTYLLIKAKKRPRDTNKIIAECLTSAKSELLKG
jgi:hypothetical protein